jgi:hypothetical protein
MLRKMRNGCIQGKYITKISLSLNTDYEIRYSCKEDEEEKKNGRVFYSDDCIAKLKSKKTS